MIGKLLCKLLRWHRPGEIHEAGINNASICKYCGRAVLQDSQGNWFSIQG